MRCTDCTAPLALAVPSTLKSVASTPLTASSKVRVKFRLRSVGRTGPSTTMLLGRGARASTRMPRVLPTLFNPVLASLPRASRRVPPLVSMLDATAKLLLPAMPLVTVRRKVNAVLPEPDR